MQSLFKNLTTMYLKFLPPILPQVDNDTTDQHLPSSVGVGALVLFTIPDLSSIVCAVDISFAAVLKCL